MVILFKLPILESDVAALLRDQSGLLHEGGGTGKNMILDWFGGEILGKQYYHVVGNNKELYGDFNSLFEGKLLVFVKEASGRDNFENNDYLKSKITSKKMSVNKKMVANYIVNDYARYIVNDYYLPLTIVILCLLVWATGV